ncbi:MAG TPA: hypothetical protein VGN72_01120 [Tepidisphaeraceae bacterium]|jgi:hypothetical protein|nr:hypothetical protein [Tepidisphaeraceae bacterium]
MPTLKIDTVRGSSLEAVDGVGTRLIRTAIVDDIDLASGNDPEALIKVLSVTGMPQLKDALPGQPSMFLRRTIVRPSLTRWRRAYVDLEYSNEFGLIPTAYIVRDDAFLQQVETNLIPGTFVPIRVNWQNPSEATEKVPADNITFSFGIPIRAISISGLAYGSPNTYQGSVGMVNAGTWAGKAAGHWRLDRYASEINKQEGTYTYNAMAVSRAYGDWSEWGVLRNQQTGRYIPIASADRTAALALAYSYGIIYPTATPDTSNKGFVRVGPYQTTNFETIFGFTDPYA